MAKEQHDGRLKCHKYRFKESMTPALMGQLFLKGDIFYIYEVPKGCHVVIDINRQFMFDTPISKDSSFIQDFIKAGEYIETYTKDLYPIEQ